MDKTGVATEYGIGMLVSVESKTAITTIQS